MENDNIYESLEKLGLKPELLDSVDSTNTLAKLRARSGEDEGYVIIASHQSGGRGRLGRSFSSPKDTGIYMSIILKPDIAPERSVLITTAAAAAVSRAIENLSGKQTQIKWVNDILIDGKKVCGILTEGSVNPQNGKLDFAVLGIGINVYRPKDGFSEDIKDIAGYIFEKREESLKSRLICEILGIFLEYYKNIEDKEYYGYYKSRCFVLDRQINILKDGKVVSTGIAVDLDEDFSLAVRAEDGKVKHLSSGEISIKTV